MDAKIILEFAVTACALSALGLAWMAHRGVGRLRVVIASLHSTIGELRAGLNWLERENEKLNEIIERLKKELGDLRIRVRRLGFDPNHKTRTGRLGELPDGSLDEDPKGAE